MRKWVSFVLVALGGLVVLACGGDTSGGPPFQGGGSGGTGGAGGVQLTCDDLDPAPDGCGQSCPNATNSECELGTFCLNYVCAARCTPTQGCTANETCNVRGLCERVSTGGTGGTGNTGGNACQSVSITPTRSIPNVMFLVDQSGSMAYGFGTNLDRWQAAHLAINSIVSDLDSIVRFGLTTYTSQNGDANPPCPRLPTQVDFALDNAGTIGNDAVYPYAYPSQDGDDTPTGDSIDALVSLIQADPPPADGPTIVVLATDGEPDSCECPDGGHPLCSQEPAPIPPRDQAVQAAQRAYEAGMELYVLWVGSLTNSSTRDHIQDVANAGVGATDAPFWIGTDPEDLETEFRTIIASSISCDIQMDERFDDKEKACNDPESDVQLNGEPLPCSDTDGWRVKPGVDDVIELVGGACDTFKSGDVTFSAEFPCGAIVVE
jgi:hypothetical protein